MLCTFARALQLDWAAAAAAAAAAETRTLSSPYGQDAGGSENVSIESFLESALVWAEAFDVGASQGLASTSLWKKFSVFLYCVKIYE